MGHTNSTANLGLPQFIGTDKPTWLGDINSAFSDIDAYAGTNDAAVAGAVSDAASAVAQAGSAVSTANAANTTAGNASTAATNAVGTANNAMSLVNQTNTKIGTLANLNTTDKTSIVNAINETFALAGNDSVSVTGDGVKTYAQLFDALHALIDPAKVRPQSVLTARGGVFQLMYFGADYVFSTLQGNSATECTVVTHYVKSTGSNSHIWKMSTSQTTVNDSSGTVFPNGEDITLIY